MTEPDPVPAAQEDRPTMAELVDTDDEPGRAISKKEVKKLKKAKKKERELLERFPPVTPFSGATEPEPAADVPTPEAQAVPIARPAREQKPTADRHLQDWLRPASRHLYNRHLVTAHEASALIAINCLMLSVAALATFRAPDVGHLWLAFIPLALTNVLSLLFAVLCARV